MPQTRPREKKQLKSFTASFKTFHWNEVMLVGHTFLVNEELFLWFNFFQVWFYPVDVLRPASINYKEKSLLKWDRIPHTWKIMQYKEN